MLGKRARTNFFYEGASGANNLNVDGDRIIENNIKHRSTLTKQVHDMIAVARQITILKSCLSLFVTMAVKVPIHINSSSVIVMIGQQINDLSRIFDLLVAEEATNKIKTLTQRHF